MNSFNYLRQLAAKEVTDRMFLQVSSESHGETSHCCTKSDNWDSMARASNAP